MLPSGTGIETRTTYDLARQHMQAATLFRDGVVRLEQRHVGEALGPFFEVIRSHVSVCILSIAASLEALVNELFLDPDLDLRTRLVDLETDFWGEAGIERKPILDKYVLALAKLGRPRLNKTTSPYQDVWALLELRNALVHYKPTWDPERRDRAKLEDVLKSRFAQSPFSRPGSDFLTMGCMGAGCCRWAVDSAFAFLREFAALAGLDERKMAGFWVLDA